MAPHVVTGQGTNGPLQVEGLRGPMHFWSRHHRMPPAGNSIIVYNNGDVVEGFDFPFDVQGDPEIYRFLLGGQRHTVDPDEDQWLYDTLVEAGYDLIPET